jgi:uncharacterized repeat protein (TIGR01451 family)
LPQNSSRLNSLEQLEDRFLLADAGTLNITKIADVSSIAHGGTIAYSFAVQYTPGNDGTPAQNVAVADAECNATPTFTGGDTNPANGMLDGGETWSFGCSKTVSAAHSASEEDPIQNTATASGQDLDGDTLTPDLSNTVSVNITHTAGTLTITKSAGAATIAHNGTVTYTFDVTYAPGSDGSPAQNIVVTDPQCSTGTLTGPNTSTTVDPDNDADTLLELNEMWRYTCTFAVPAAHAAGEEDPILNTATVSGQDLDGDAVTGDSSSQVSVDILHDAGTLTIVKTADRTTVNHGQTITYTFNVSYAPGADGSPAQNIVVTDPQCTSAIGGPNTSTTVDPDNDADALLEANETWRYTCTFAVPATHSAGEEDPILNTATVTGQDLDGNAVTGDTSNEVSVDILHGGTISGRKFNDQNGDGSGTGDPGRNGVTITLFRDTNGNGTFETGTDTQVATQQTSNSGGVDGRYSFGDLTPGTYFVQETVPTGSAQTAPPSPGIYTVTIVTDEIVADRDLGNFVNITISGAKFLDLNNDGVFDDDEPGLEDWVIFLDTDGDGSLDSGETSTMTDEDGDYSFANLGPGTYRVREVLQAGWRRTSDDPAAITASSGQNRTAVDFGNLPIADAMLVENPDTGEMDLLVTGTVDPDRIFVRPTQPPGTVDVHLNDLPTESFVPTGRIVVQSFEGDDVVSISRRIELPSHLDTGEGNDTARGGSGDDLIMGQDDDDRLRGRPGDDLLRAGDGDDLVRAGRGNDIALGEDGDDLLRGARGRDILIGGEGEDTLKGDNQGHDERGNVNDGDNGGNGNGGHGREKNQDILIGGTTDHDADDEALQAILAEWISARSYEDRVDNIRDGSGSATSLNDDFFLDDTTVFGDDELDILIGSIGRDWFFAPEDDDTSDQLLDRQADEFVDELV